MRPTTGRTPRGNSCIDRAMFVLACLVFSPAMLYLGFSSLSDDLELGRRGVTIEAALTDTQVEKTSGNRETYHVKYQFTLGGGNTRYSCSDRTGRRDIWCGVTAEQWRLTQATKRVTVIYLPDRPWTNQPLHGTISTFDSMAGVFLGIGPWVVAFLVLLINWSADRPSAGRLPGKIKPRPQGESVSRTPTSEAARQLAQRGDASYHAGDRRRAIQAYSEALRREPDCVYLLVQRGLALQEERRLAEAIRDYDRAIQLDPNYGPAYYGRGWARGWQNDHAGALEDAQRGYQLDPRSPGMYLRRVGSALAGLKRYDEALQAYSKAIELNPADEGTLLNRAICYREAGQYDLALKDINRALELDPDWDWAFYRRGQIYEHLGEPDLAVRDYQQALHYNPGYKPAQEALRHVRRR
jgi:tetratricopeptide (TPR) repeat protein